jgi:hypothetical protein
MRLEQAAVAYFPASDMMMKMEIINVTYMRFP